MKYEKHLSRLFAVLIAFALGYAGIACMVTGFNLNVDMQMLAINCLLLAVVASFAVSKWWTNLLFFAGLLVLGYHLWNAGDLERSVEGLLYEISLHYNSAYGWGILYWNSREPDGMALEMALCLLAMPAIWLGTFAVVRRRSAVFTLFFSAIPLGVCMVVTSAVPQVGWLIVLFTAALLLILTQTVRRREERDGNRLTAILLIPAILCTALLFWAVPEDGYSPQVSTPQWMLNLLDVGGPLGIGGDGIGILEDSAVELTGLGPKSLSRQEVMRVHAETPGLMYLRGQSYDHYDGTSWLISTVDTTQDAYWPTKNMTEMGSVRIYTKKVETLRFLPYYPRGNSWREEMIYGKVKGIPVKTYIYNRQSAGANSLATEVDPSDELVVQCLQLPEQTRLDARDILKSLNISSDASARTKAALIREYVKYSAAYDINTQEMPEGEKDFALWFLEDADTGYCVHFATAAAVLLRTANVPARYVTGYMVQVGEGGTMVEERNSHAWVEYLDPDRGWTVLDATPEEAQVLPEPPTDPTTEPTVTEPEPTTESSESTEPTQSQPVTESTEATEEASEPTETVAATESQAVESIGTPIREDLDLTGLWKALQIAGLLAAALAVLFVPYGLRLYLRRRKMYKGERNRQAVACWCEVSRLSRLLKQTIPEELEDLAEKAKFSQHTLTEDELSKFHEQLAILQTVQKEKGWLFRLLFRWFFATE